MLAMSCTVGVLPPVDDLIAFPFGLREKKAAKELIKSGELKARKIGRRWYAKRSDVLALIDSAPPAAPASGVDLKADLAAIANRTRRGGK